MINLENFPTSEAAKRMMKTISPIYDKSYVAKWLFQVMGAEWDQAWSFFNELRLQAFPETATWGIAYWEQQYHIPPDDNLTIEERRQHVIVKRGKRYPMNPAKLEQISEEITGFPAIVTEQNTEYSFTVSILTTDYTVDLQALTDFIKAVKPSHLGFIVRYYYSKWSDIMAKQADWASVKNEMVDWRAVYNKSYIE